MSLTIEEKYELIKKNLKEQKSKNPIEIIKSLMHSDFIDMHGPEHHFLDGACFMRALYNAGLEFDFDSALDTFAQRTIKMPGAMCGLWGVCGSVASLGAVFALLDGTGPLSQDESYKSHMEFTSSVIKKMSEIGGPRCCKRNAFISIMYGVQYAKSHYNINIELPSNIECEFSNFNKQCIGNKCPFNKVENK